MSEEPEFWTQRDAAGEYTRLAGACEALFAALGALAPQLPPSSAVPAATLARRMGAHAAAWAELVPESILLAEARDAAPSVVPIEPAWVPVHAAIEALRRDLGALLTRSSPVADGAARRVARAVLADLDRGVDPSLG
jgi:hypothetical protein